MTSSGTVVVGGARASAQAVTRRLAHEPWAGPLVIADIALDSCRGAGQ